MRRDREGIEKTNRELLERLHRRLKGPFTATEAAEVLRLPLPRSRRLLSYLASRGWLSRVRRGLYTTVPLGASAPSDWREDPWIVAAKLYEPCYIGGFSACEYWDLTEQIFRGVVVFTATPLREREIEVQGTSFRLKSVDERKLFGTRSEWRDSVRVQVSDPSRTVVDTLDDPSIGGGIRHVASVLANYFESEDRDDRRLTDYVKKLGNRTVFKRLGYLLELYNIAASETIAVCRRMLSSGLSPLDPSVRTKGKVVKRWNIRANVSLSPERELT
jgi:predicted transcriptional regulator of viral defense system